MSELTCPSCGKQLVEYTRFCPECGARLPEPQPEAPATPAAPPPGGLRTVILPPAEAAPPADTPPQQPAAPAPIAPTQRLDVPAQPDQRPADALPPSPVTTLPTAAPYPAGGASAPAAPGSRRTLWWVLGGVGCLSVLLLGACLSIGALTLLGQRVSATAEMVETPPEAVEAVEPGQSSAGAAVLLEDDFSDPGVSNLDVSEDETSRSAYEDGGYTLEVKEPETLVWVLLGGPYSDVGVEVATEVAASSDIAAAGLVFHYQDDDNFYLFSVTNDGYYALEVLQAGEWTVLIDPTLSDEVNENRNTLRVETSGGRIALYVNDALLEETIDDTFTAGEIGLAVSTFENSTGTVRFDDLVVTGSE